MQTLLCTYLFFNFRARGIKPIETKKPVPKPEPKKSISDPEKPEEETENKKKSKFKVKVVKQNVAEEFIGVINR